MPRFNIFKAFAGSAKPSSHEGENPSQGKFDGHFADPHAIGQSYAQAHIPDSVLLSRRGTTKPNHGQQIVANNYPSVVPSAPAFHHEPPQPDSRHPYEGHHPHDSEQHRRSPQGKSWSPVPSIRRSISSGQDITYEHMYKQTDDALWHPPQANSPLGHHMHAGNQYLLPSHPAEPPKHVYEDPHTDYSEQPMFVPQRGHDPRAAKSSTRNRTGYRAEIIEPIIYEHDPWNRNGKDGERNTYQYIVPAGMNVIFQDEDGNEITRVGDFDSHGRPRRSYRSSPIVVQDEFGNELYRSESSSHTTGSQEDMYGKDHEGRRHQKRSHHRQRANTLQGGTYNRPAHTANTKIIYIDRDGRQIPMAGSQAAKHMGGMNTVNGL